MADRVIATGVTLRCVTAAAPAGDALELTAEVWAEVEQKGEPDRFRVGGNFMYAELSLGEDPTRSLIDIAYEQRELNLGGILGDLRIGGADVTRFECYAAPFRVELDESLRELLSGTWDERDPWR
jgi:hypothetical protein